MTRARDIADLVDANGDIVAGALDNVPASNDASALTTGTLPAARLGADSVDNTILDLASDFAGIHIGGTGADNELDDYEEGTFQVTLARSGVTGSDPNNNTQTAQYVKIGRMVFIDFTRKGSTAPYWKNGTGNYSSGQAVTITSNLPFSPNSSNSVHLGHCRTLNDYDSLGLGWRSGSTTIYLGTGDDNNYVKHNNATTSNSQSNVTVQAQFCYFTTS